MELTATPPPPRTPEQIDADTTAWFERHRRRVNARAMTAVAWMGYDVDDDGRGVGLMNLEPYCSADGRGVVAVFEEAIPGIAHIQVFIDGAIDMVYKRSAAGVWRGQRVKERTPQA